jgi:hypothetical protein
MNLQENWGNYVLIRAQEGVYVLLAHLRQGSVCVAVGDYLTPGQALGRCGNSGRSAQPHLHLSVVCAEHPGAETLPFHLIGVLMRKADTGSVFHLWSTLQQDDRVTAAWLGAVRPLALLVGRGRVYRVREADGVWRQWRIQLQVTLDGRFRLVSDRGASCLCEWNGAIFACYGREGARDVLFDLWMLAAGCTPASEQATQWCDRPSARLLPGHRYGMGALLWPVVTQAEAAYKRTWDDAAQLWRQTGQFHFSKVQVLEIKADISFEIGLSHLHAQNEQKSWEMELTGAYQAGDAGVPEREWSESHNQNAQVAG